MEQNKSLVMIASEIAMLEKKVMEANGEITPEIEALMDLSTGNLIEKIDRTRYVMDAFDTRAMYFKDIENQAYAGRKLFENSKDRLKQNLKKSMTMMNTDELCGESYRYKLSISKPKLRVVDEALIPVQYKKEKVTTTMVADMELIENDLALGVEIPGVAMERTETLRGYIHGANKPKQVKESKNE